MTTPPNAHSRQWMHRARDGTGLFVECTEPERSRAAAGEMAPAGVARGSILVTHGMGEHSGRYGHVVRRLSEAGMRVVTWDLRGHGRSEGRRGDVPDYEVLVEDLREVCACAQPEGGPLFLYGHSLGGQITLNFAVRHRPEAAGLVITSPWLRLAFAPPLWKRFLAWVAARLWPAFSQDTEVGPARLSRDLAFLASMPDPQLVHHRMSARMFQELEAGAASALRDGVQLPYPILLVHGSADTVTSFQATEEFYAALCSADKSLVIVPGALHETHNDLCREVVLSQITAWLDARLPPL